MTVAATQTNGETNQFIGSLAQMLYGVEASWGTHPSAASRTMRIVSGESIDQNVGVYRSRQIRPDRTHNAPVLGSQDPGGMIPFELSPEGWNPFLYSLLLPSAITTTGPTGGLINPASPPTAANAGTAGSIPSGTYYYVYTATNASGETLPSPVSLSGQSASPSNNVLVTMTTVSSATGYNVYRSTSSSGPFFYVGTSATTSYTDTVAATGAQPPSTNTTGASHTHTMKAGTTGQPLNVGFTLEKGFIDPVSASNVFELIVGNKVDKCKIDFKIDAIVSGSFEVIGQKFTTSGSSAFSNGGNPPSLPNEDPYSGAYIAIYEGSNAVPVGVASGNPLGLCNDLSLSIDNAYYRKNGFILGSQYRQNLKPGSRMTTFSGKFMFQDLALYNKAINATNTSVKIVCTSQNGFYSHIFDMPTVRLTPNGSSPKISSDGPLEISLAGEALFDETIGSDLQLTIQTPEVNLTT